ncbi:MAG: DEAD/DEAH box helicase family protein [Culturomica sp.]|jgi:superfamily II DNA or RNA helicase|nr:DEAD/DEAH box helicase family protein [Culturomica sp.]
MQSQGNTQTSLNFQSESDLRKRIADLEAQNLALLHENQQLREKFQLPPKEEIKQGTFSKYNTPNEKIELFMSLFRGRNDVYAKRCYSKKYGNSYYMPACKNEWVKGICDRPRIKCKNCNHRELAPMTKEVIDSHLRNKDENGTGIAGIYPLLPDETSWFLAVDFDEEGWQKDIAAFRSVCQDLHVPVAIERSRSGNGAHAWLFFDEPLPAVVARKLGNSLLTRAMSIRHEIKFSSYDRMFPNQDFMPKGGFGNLIALPLQGGARKNGNSEFIDKNFNSYSDQWAYLASLKKISAEEVKQLLAELCEGNGLGELANKENEDDTPKPWEKKPQEIHLMQQDFPKSLTIVEANRLYIPKKDVSQRALNRIKRLAAFANPVFYKTQRMRMSTYGIPRIIYSLDETDEYIGIPRGCRESLIKLLEDAKLEYCFEDKMNVGNTIQVRFNGTLREEQQLAVDTLLQHTNGVLSLPTAFGKTVIGASLIANRKCNTLILVHLHTLLAQWKKSLEQFLDIDEILPKEDNPKRGRKKIKSIIGQIGSGKNTASGIVDIAIVQSLIHNNEVDDRVKDYGMVIVDECHHVPSVNYEKVLAAVNARYVYGLTATTTRQDGQHPITFMQCGFVRYNVSAKEQSGKHNFEHFLIPCFTGFQKPFVQNESEWHITQIYSDLVNSEIRNRQIIADVIRAVEDKRTPIILTQRKEHVNILSTLLRQQSDAEVIGLLGANSAKEKQAAMEKLATVSTDQSLIIVATGKYVGEGFDYPRLDTLFLAMPIAWKGTLAQYTGRLHRDYSGKQSVRVYDYVDIHVPVLERMYHKRLSAYAQIGYKTTTVRNQHEKVNLIYSAQNFMPVIRQDLLQAKEEIIFSYTATSQKKVKTIQQTLQQQQPRINVIIKPNKHLQCVIIDRHIVWYSGFNLLSESSEGNLMRLDSNDLAKELQSVMDN